MLPFTRPMPAAALAPAPASIIACRTTRSDL
jgi:hypothetical protein